MKISPLIMADGQAARALSIARGESLEVPIIWANADGSPRPMEHATVTVETYAGTSRDQVPAAQRASYGTFTDEGATPTPRLLLSASASSTLVRGQTYVLRIIETRPGSDPDTVSSAEVRLRVE